ncbi:hypothetical protein DAPPUDRAFT_242267 [Daphnia pulex]|uniref:Uncharacterized protein n=1 Tax=Daphnia pulex TaxID=6669 RepID=E9GG87_DAPPU|nr:hypothetical protein DAPPUDRAFT_242267 [Daphnia pulex]|eukprot:EFX81357.1 hypothetical protein DAPPUDRAFT_242267 [Daphnia pulex]
MTTTSGLVLNKDSWDYQILHKTVFAEPRGEQEPWTAGSRLGYNLSRTVLIKTVDIGEVRRSLAFVSIPLSLSVGIPIDVISLTRASGMSRLPLDALMLGYLPLPSATFCLFKPRPDERM